jgi:hypothetical protein
MEAEIDNIGGHVGVPLEASPEQLVQGWAERTRPARRWRPASSPSPRGKPQRPRLSNSFSILASFRGRACFFVVSNPTLERRPVDPLAKLAGCRRPGWRGLCWRLWRCRRLRGLGARRLERSNVPGT